MTDKNVLNAIRQAVSMSPDNLPLRQHLADLLFAAEEYGEASAEYQQVLEHTPQDHDVKFRLATCYYRLGKPMVAVVILEQIIQAGQADAQVYLLAARNYQQAGQKQNAYDAYQQAVQRDPTLQDAELASLKPNDDRIAIPATDWPQRHTEEEGLEKSRTTFEHVGGMDQIKDEIRMKIIHPLNNPQLYQAYGKTIGGGILMYGPPGCGKTHLARATAGEVKAYFMTIGIHDILNLYLGESERKLHQMFETARRNAPCVIFIDEVDALGANRGDLRYSAGRNVINQLLSELDGVNTSNEGVLILAATNAPWYLDPAFRRPGRFDRIIFVPPPDAKARVEILRVILRDKPAENIDVEKVTSRTTGYSGADLKAVVDQAVEGKLKEAMAMNKLLPITTDDLLQALKAVKPSTSDWFATARNYAVYANETGTYDDVLHYLENSSDMLSRFKFWRGNDGS